MQHVHQLVLVLRLHQHAVGHAARVREVEQAVVRGAVVGRKPGAIHAEDHGQILQRDVMDDGIVGTLQERRVNRHDRTKTLRRQAGGKQHRMLLGDADVEKLLRACLREM